MYTYIYIYMYIYTIYIYVYAHTIYTYICVYPDDVTILFVCCVRAEIPADIANGPEPSHTSENHFYLLASTKHDRKREIK